MKLSRTAKRILSVALILSLCLLFTGCAGRNAKKAWSAVKDLGYTSDSTTPEMAFYVKYDNKSALHEFPNEEIWNTLPESGYCYLFVGASPTIAYADKSGNTVYAYDCERLNDLANEASYYFDSIAPKVNAKDVSGAKAAAALGSSLTDTLEAELPYLDFIKGELLMAAMVSDGIMASELKYKPLSEKEIASLNR